MKIGDIVFYVLTIGIPICLLGWVLMQFSDLLRPLLTALGGK